MVLIELQWRVFAKSLTPSSAAPERSAGYQQRSCWRQLQRNVRPVADALIGAHAQPLTDDHGDDTLVQIDRRNHAARDTLQFVPA
jgi:hypothetical protein